MFYYSENDIADELIECGIKSDTYAERVITQNGSEVKCILTYLHPADCEKYNDDDFVPIKIKAPADYSYVAEGAFYNQSGEENELYDKSIIPLRSYKVGMYRKDQMHFITKPTGAFRQTKG